MLKYDYIKVGEKFHKYVYKKSMMRKNKQILTLKSIRTILNTQRSGTTNMAIHFMLAGINGK